MATKHHDAFPITKMFIFFKNEILPKIIAPSNLLLDGIPRHLFMLIQPAIDAVFVQAPPRSMLRHKGPLCPILLKFIRKPTYQHTLPPCQLHIHRAEKDNRRHIHLAQLFRPSRRSTLLLMLPHELL